MFLRMMPGDSFFYQTCFQKFVEYCNKQALTLYYCRALRHLQTLPMMGILNLQMKMRMMKKMEKKKMKMMMKPL